MRNPALRLSQIFSLASAFGFANSAQAFRVASFTPEGTVKNVRQVVARFSEPMVAFGDPRTHGEAFAVDCAGAKGSARWIDAREWAYDFEGDLPAGLACRFTLQKGLKSVAGTGPDAQAPTEFRFDTGGVAILRTTPWEEAQIVEDQTFVLTLDAEVDPQSLPGKLQFAVEGIASPVDFKLVEGKVRKAVVRQAWVREIPDARILVVQPTQVFPQSAGVTLRWGRGIRTKSGAETTADQTLTFKVRPPLRAEFTCTRENPEAACSPLAGMGVQFTSQVPRKFLEKIRLRAADGSVVSPKLGDEAEASTYVSFGAPLPPNASFEVVLPAGLRDEDGRKLDNESRFPLRVGTSDYPPLAKFSGNFGILELKAGGVLPVSLRKLEPEVAAKLKVVDAKSSAFDGASLKVQNDGAAIVHWLSKVSQMQNYDQRAQSIFEKNTASRSFQVPKPNGADAFEVVGIPLEKPGLYVVELESPALGRALLERGKGPMRVSTAALVTNLAVHFKWGKERSLVWVTSLDRGEPVGQAAVEIYDCRGQSLWKGQTDREGRALIQGSVSQTWRSVPHCEDLSYFVSGLLVVAKAGDDMSFTSSSWSEGIEPWRYKVPVDYDSAPSKIVHTIFDRTLFRAGETVHMKHVARWKVMEGFRSMPAQALGPKLQILHVATDQKFELPVKWSARGQAETQWSIPKDAKLGRYAVQLAGETIGEFAVEEYRVPLMKASLSSTQSVFVAPRAVPLQMSVQYLAGGPAGNLPVQVRTAIQDASWNSPEFDEFTFGSAAIHEGIEKRREWDDANSESPAQRTKVVPLTLDGAGGARTEVESLARVERPLKLEAEMEYRDPNGALQTSATDVTLLPAERMVGLKLTSWISVKDKMRVQLVVLDAQKKPVAKAPVEVTAYVEKSYSHRKRLVGGFYAYENFNEVKKDRVLCRVETDEHGLATCEAPAEKGGNFILQAVARDGAGRSSYARGSLWVAAEQNSWFSSEDNDRMDVLPERTRYEPGETARIQVRTPFREATALIAVEREGVVETYVRHLSSKDPTVEIPIQPSYAPNVFVSALVVRGRISDAPPPTGLADLAKPAFRFGVTELKVGWRAHELKVRVLPEREEYRVRERAKVRFEVRDADGKAPPAGTELTVAAVDEGLLQLRENDSWKLLRAMMGQRHYQVATATAQGYVVGKRHFGQKAKPPGGGGGRAPTRELFDSLLYWKGTVPVDAQGRAEVEVPLNDSLTAFRIAAIAIGGVDQFGDGEGQIRSTQDLMLLPGLPPLVRNGDRFPAQLTVRNASARELNVEAKGRCVAGCKAEFAVQRATLKAGEAKTIEWPVEVPADVHALEYAFEATAGAGVADSLRVKQKVLDPLPVRVFQAQLDRLDAPRAFAVERPQGALPGRGGLNLIVSPSLADGALDGVRREMEAYPYTCLEQQTSRAVALGDAKGWQTIREKIPAYVDGNGLFKYFPPADEGSVVLTAYVLAISQEAGWTLPDSVRDRALGALEAFVQGRSPRSHAGWVPAGSVALEKLSALEAISRFRPVPEKWLASIALEPNLWPNSALLDWISLLRRAKDWPKRDAWLVEAQKILKSRLNYQGSVVNFAQGPATNLFGSWFMSSSDSEAVRTLLAASDDAAWADELPRLVRGALARQRRGAWDLTTANAWGTLAIAKFSRLHEKTPVDGKVMTTVGSAKSEVKVTAKGGPVPLALPWPEAKSEFKASFAGAGAPWLTTQSLAALPLKAPLSTGLRIEKKIEAVSRKNSKAWSVGDIVRVRLRIDAQSELGWVAVSDPVPAGAQVLGTGLGNDSKLANVPSASRSDARRLWPSFQELSFEGMRSYYDYVPKGVFEMEYTYRLNQAGKFQLPNTRAEAMYAPEMLGESPNAEFTVQP